MAYKIDYKIVTVTIWDKPFNHTGPSHQFKNLENALNEGWKIESVESIDRLRGNPLAVTAYILKRENNIKGPTDMLTPF